MRRNNYLAYLGNANKDFPLNIFFFLLITKIARILIHERKLNLPLVTCSCTFHLFTTYGISSFFVCSFVCLVFHDNVIEVRLLRHVLNVYGKVYLILLIMNPMSYVTFPPHELSHRAVNPTIVFSIASL